MTQREEFPSLELCHACAAGAIKIKRHGRIQHLATFGGKPVWTDCETDRELSIAERKVLREEMVRMNTEGPDEYAAGMRRYKC